jgi:hypothetical protein
MLIYCFTITAILFFVVGFVLGYILGSSNGTKGKESVNSVTFHRELPKEFADFLNYNGIPRQ